MGGGGGYLLLVLNPPWTPEHKEAILQRVAKGLLSWDVKATGTDLTSAEKVCLSVKVSAGPHNELLIQHSTESLALEVLLNPEVSTLRQCFKNMMVSGTTHKHVIHAGYAFAGSGDWILQDGVFSARDVEALLHDAEVQEVLRRQKFHTLHVHCSAEGSWAQPPVGVCLNPPDIADSLAGSAHLLGCLDAVLTSPPLTSLLPSSSVVGNIRFRRPTMYVFPGGQGDCALFGVTGFTLLVDGGFARKPCFWEFVRHLDRLDSLLVTRFNQFNSCGLTALAQRKALERVYPQVGHVFCNAVRSPSDEELQKDRDQLVVSVVAQGLEFLQGVREMGLSPQACQRDVRPHTLYHKVGHGTLEMFVLSPGRSTEEDTSVCALLVWRPAKVSEPVTRILLPGSASQSVIFEGLNKLGHLAVLKSREVTAEARLGLKKSKVQDKPLRATSVPPRPSVAKRAAVKAESPSPSPTPPPAEKHRAAAKPTNKSVESLPKKQDEVKRPSKTSAKKEPKKAAAEKADTKEEKVAKITAKIPAKVGETMPDKEKMVEKLGENELDNIPEKDISKIISDKPLKKLPVEIEKIDTKAQEEIVAKVDEKVAAKRELKKATPARPPAKSKGAKDVTNKMAVESKTIARKTAEPAKVKPRPVVAPPTRPMVRDSKSKSPSSSASSSPKRAPPKPTTERPVRSVRGGVRTAKPAAAEPVKAVEVEKPLLTEKPTAQVKPDKRIEAVALSGDESSGSKEAIEEKAATEATKEDKPFIEPSSSDESKKDILKQKSPTVDEVPIKAVLLGTAHATPATDEVQAVPTKPLEKEIVDAEMWPTEGNGKELVEPPEHALSPEPTISASSEGVPSLVDEVIDISLKADSSVAMQIAEPELSRVRALSSGQRTPDSLDTPREVGDGTAPSSRDEILEAMEKHQLVSREQVLEIKRRDSVDSIEGEIAMEDEEIVHPPQEADAEPAGALTEKVQPELEKPVEGAPVSEAPEVVKKETAEPETTEELQPTTGRPAEGTTESPVPEFAEQTPQKSETVEKVDQEIKKTAPDIHATELSDTALRKPAESEDSEKVEPAIERADEPTSVSVVSEFLEKRPTETESSEKVEPEIPKQPDEPQSVQNAVPALERPSEKAPSTAVHDVAKPAEHEGTQIEEPWIETPAGETLVDVGSHVAEKYAKPESVKEKETEIKTKPEETPYTSVAGVDEQKPAKSEILQHAEPEIERPADDTLRDAVPDVELKKPKEHEDVKELQPEIESPTEETPVSAVPEVKPKKTTEHEVVEKLHPQIERPMEVLPASAEPEVTAMKPAEHEGVEKLQPEVESPIEKAPVSTVPVVDSKRPTELESDEKMEREVESPTEETPVSAVAELEPKKPVAQEGVEKLELEVERPAAETTFSEVPKVEAMKPTEQESVEKLEREVERSTAETHVTAVPEGEPKKPTQEEGVEKPQPEVERSIIETPVSTGPEVEAMIATEHEGVEKLQPELPRPTEVTPVRAVPQVERKKRTEEEVVEKPQPEVERPTKEIPVSTLPVVEPKPTEHKDDEKLEWEVERPTEETLVSAVSEVQPMKPAEQEGIEKLQPKVERPTEETPVGAVPEVQPKKLAEQDDVQDLQPEVERPTQETLVSALPGIEPEMPTEHDGVEKLQPEVERPTRESPVSAVPEVQPKKPAEHEYVEKRERGVEKPTQEAPVSAIHAVEPKTPTDLEGVEKLQPEVERPTEVTPVSAVTGVEPEKPEEHDDVGKLQPEVERPTDEAPVSAVHAVESKKPTEHDGVEKLQPEVEKPTEETPVSAVPGVEPEKSREHDDVEKLQPEVDRPPEETPVSAVPAVEPEKPGEHDGVEKLQPEVERPTEGTPVSAVHAVESKKPTEHDGVEKLQPEVERPTEGTPVSAVPGVESEKPPGHDGVEKLQPEVERPTEETSVSAVPEVEPEKPTAHDGLEKLQPEVERPTEETSVSAVPGVEPEKPTEHDGVEKLQPKVESPTEESPLSAVPGVDAEKPTEHDGVEKLQPEVERPTEGTPVSALSGVEPEKPTGRDGAEKLQPEVERPTEETSVSAVPGVDVEKPTEHAGAGKLQSEVERPTEETAVSAVPGVEPEKPTEHEDVQKLEREVETSTEEKPISAVPEVDLKKPSEKKGVEKLQPEVERPTEETPVSAVPEVESKKATEPEGAENLEREVERPTEETPASALPQVESKKPTEHEVAEKLERDVERPTVETPVTAVPQFEPKKPTEHEVDEKLELEVETSTEEKPVSAVAEVESKKPAELDGVEIQETEVETPTERTPVSPVPQEESKKPTEKEVFEKLQPEVETSTEEKPTSAVPEIESKKPSEQKGVEKLQPEVERPTEETSVSAVPEVESKKPSEQKGVENLQPEVERPTQETSVSAVPEVESKKPTEPEGTEDLEREVEKPTVETPVSAVPQVEPKKPTEHEFDEKPELEVETSTEEKPVSAVAEVVSKKPAELDSIEIQEMEVERPTERTPVSPVPQEESQKPTEKEVFEELQPEVETSTEEKPTSAVPEIESKKPSEQRGVEKLQPDVERPTEETPVSAVPEVESKKPTKPEDTEDLEREVERSTEETPVSALPEVESKKPTEHEVAEKLEREVESPTVKTPVSAVPGVESKKPAEYEVDENLARMVEISAEEKPVSVVPEVESNKPVEQEGVEIEEPEVGRPTEQTPVSALPEVCSKKPSEQEGFEKLHPEVEKSTEETPVSAAPKVDSKIPTELEGAEKLERGLDRPTEETSMSAVPEVESKKPTEHEVAEKLERGVETSTEKKPVSAVPEVESKKPLEHEDDERLEMEVEGSTEETPVRAVPEVESKKPIEQEGVEKLQPEVERSTEETLASAVPELESKKLEDQESVEKLHPEVERPAAETPASEVPEVESKKPTEQEGAEKLELDMERLPEETPMRSMPDFEQKKPKEFVGVEKLQPDVAMAYEETAMGAVPKIEHKKKTEHERVKMLETKIEKPFEETGLSAAPEVVHKEPTEHDGFEKLKPVIERPAEETTVRAVPEAEQKKHAEHEGVEKIKPIFERPLEETPLDAVPQLDQKKPTQHEGIEKPERQIETPAEETTFIPLPEIEQKEHTEHKGVERLQPEIESPAEETTVSALPQVELKKPGVERLEPEVEKPPGETPVIAVPDVEQKKPTEEEGVERLEPKVQKSPEETHVSAVPDVDQEKPMAHESVQKLEVEHDMPREEIPAGTVSKEEEKSVKPDSEKMVEPEFDRPAEKTLVSAMPEVEQKNHDGVERLEQIIGAPTEVTFVSAAAEVEKKPSEPEECMGDVKLEAEIAKPPKETQVTAISEVDLKEPTEHEGMEKLEPEIERSPEEIPVSTLPEADEKKTAEDEGIEEQEPESKREPEKTPSGTVHEVVEKMPAQPETMETISPETGRPAAEPAFSAVPDIEKKPTEPESAEKLELKIVSAVPEVVKKPERVEKLEPEVEKPPVSVVAEVEDKKPAEPYSAEMVKPEIERPIEETPISAIPQVTEKKPAERESVEKLEQEIEKATGQLPLSAMTEEGEKKHTKPLPQSVEKVEPEIGRPPEPDTLDSLLKDTGKKSPDPESVGKLEPEIVRYQEEAPVSTVPKVQEKKATELASEGKIEPRIEGPAEDISVSPVPEGEKRPTEPETILSAVPAFEREIPAEPEIVTNIQKEDETAEDSAAKSLDVVAEKELAEPVDIRKMEPETERPADNSFESSVPEVVEKASAEQEIVPAVEQEKKPGEPEGIQKEKSDIERPAKDTPVSAVSESTERKLSEPGSIQTIEQGIGTPAEEIAMTAVAEVAERLPSGVDDIKREHEYLEMPDDISVTAMLTDKEPTKQDDSHEGEPQIEKSVAKTQASDLHEILDTVHRESPGNDIHEKEVPTPVSETAEITDAKPVKAEDVEKTALHGKPLKPSDSGNEKPLSETPEEKRDKTQTEKPVCEASISFMTTVVDRKPPEYDEQELHLEKPEDTASASTLKETEERKPTKQEDIASEKPCFEEQALETPVSTAFYVADRKSPELEVLEKQELEILEAGQRSPISTLSEIPHEKTAEPEHREKQETSSKPGGIGKQVDKLEGKLDDKIPVEALTGTADTKPVTPQCADKEEPQVYQPADTGVVPELADEKPSQLDFLEKREPETEKPASKVEEVVDETHIKPDMKTVGSGDEKRATSASEIPAAADQLDLETGDLESPGREIQKEEQYGRDISPSAGDKRESNDMKDILDRYTTQEPVSPFGHQEPEMVVSSKDKPETKSEEIIAEQIDKYEKASFSEQSSLDQEGIVTSPGDETADEDGHTSIRSDIELDKTTAEVHEVQDIESAVDEVVDEGVVTSPSHSIEDDALHLHADSENAPYDGVHITEIQDKHGKEQILKPKEEPSGGILGHIQPKDVDSGDDGLQVPQDGVTVPHLETKEVKHPEEHKPSSSEETPAADHLRKISKDEGPQQDVEDIQLRESVASQSFLFGDTCSSDAALPAEASDLHQPGYLPEDYDILPSTALIPEVDGTIAEDLIAAKEQAQKQLEDEDDVPPSFSRASSDKDHSATEKDDGPLQEDRLPGFTKCSEKPSEHQHTQTKKNEKDNAPAVSELSDDASKVSEETAQQDIQELRDETDSFKPHDCEPSVPTDAERQILHSDISKGTGRRDDLYGALETTIDKASDLPSYPLTSEDAHELKTDVNAIPKLSAQKGDSSFPEMLQNEAVDSMFPEKKSIVESLDSKPDISEGTSLSAAQVSLPSEKIASGDSIADKATEAEHLRKIDKLSHQEIETDAAISEEHLQRDKVPETEDVKGSDEHKISSIVSQDRDRDSREALQGAALKSGDKADSLKAHEESVLHAESEIISEQSDDQIKIHASPAHRDQEDHAGKELPADTSCVSPADGSLDKSVSPKPSSTGEVKMDVTKQEFYLSLDAAPGAVTSLYSKAKELLEECVTATDSTSPGGALSTGSPKSSVSEDSFRSVVQKDDSRDILAKEEQCDDKTCDESVLPASGVTTGYDFRSPTEVLKRDFLEETSNTLAKALDETMMLPSPSQDEEGRQLLEVIKSQLLLDESVDCHVTPKEHDLPTAKDIPPADSSKYVPSGTHAVSGDKGLDKSPDSTKKRDEALSTILDQITKDDWDEVTHSEPDKIQVSEDAVELQSRLSEDSTTAFQRHDDAPLGSEDQREPSGSGHLLVKGAPEEEKSVPVPSELSTALHKPESPSAHMEVSEEIRPETSLLQESGSITRKDSKTQEDGSVVPESHISQSSPADDSLKNLSEERVPHLPSDLDTSSATDPSSLPVPLKESASHIDVPTISDREEPGSPSDLKITPDKGVVCDSRLSSGSEGTKARDEAPHAEADEKETASRGSPSLIHQEQESYVPEAPWVHHRNFQDTRSSEISDQPMKDPRATCPTSLDAPELAHMQQRVSVDYDSSITSVSDIEFAVDAKAFRAVAPDESSHDDSKTAECPKGEKDASRPSSPESPPQSPVKRIAADHPRASKRARTTSESKHPISTQGSSEADISSEDEDSTRKATAHSYTDAPMDGVESPKYSPQSDFSSLPGGIHPVKDQHLVDSTKESAEHHVAPQGADYHDSRHSPSEDQPGSLSYSSEKTEGSPITHKRAPSEERDFPAGDSPSRHVPDSSSTSSQHDIVQASLSPLEPGKTEISGDRDSRRDEKSSSQLKRPSIESETTSSSDDAGSGRRSLTSSKDSDLMREYSKHLETSPSARFSVDSTCSVTSEERSYTELEKPYQKEDSRESFSSTAREYPDDSSRSGSLYSDSTVEPSSTVDHRESISPHVSLDQVELGSSGNDLLPVKPERPTEIGKMEQGPQTYAAISPGKESAVQAPLGDEKVTKTPEGHISPAAKILMTEDRQSVTDVAHGHGIASGLFAALKTELCVIDSPAMENVLGQTAKDVHGTTDQASFDTSRKSSEEHRELDWKERKIPETERETPKEQAHSRDEKVGAAHDKESKETHSVSEDGKGPPGRKVSGEVTPVKTLRFQLGDDSSIEPLADQTDASALCSSSDADHGISKEVFERKVRLEKFLEAEFLEAMATDEEDESSRSSVKQSTTSTTSSSHHKGSHKVTESEDNNTEDDVTLAFALSSGLPTELVCIAQSSVDLPKDITHITKCADSQEGVSPPQASPVDAVKQDEPAAVAAGLASGLSVELVCMVESEELCSEIKRAEEEAIHHVIEKKADYAVDDDGVAMQAYIERRLSDSDHFTDKKQRSSPPSETASASLEGIPTPERKTSKSFDELHLNGTSHSPPSVGLVAGLAAGLATELVCMPQSAEELCIDASESRWPPAQGSRVEIMPPEMTASIYEERPEHIGEKPCTDTDVESLGRGTPESPVLHRTGQIPVQREVITTVTSRRVVYQNDGPPDTWPTSTFSEPPQHDTDDDSRRTTVTYVYRTYTSAEDNEKDDPVISSGTVPSRQGEDGLPFEILRSTAQRHAREEDGHDEGDHVTGTSSRSYVYTVSSDHGAPETFIHHTDDTGTLHHPDSSIHSIAMDEVARITEMAAAAVSQSPNGWTVVHRSADSSSQRPLELTRPSELVERRNGHVTHVTETRQIVYHPSSSAEMRLPMASSAEETCLPPEGSDPKTILEFMAAQTKQAAKEMLEEQPLYEEDEEAAQEQSSLSDASPLVEEPVFGKTLQPDYPELVELSAGNTPSEPPSPHSAVHDTRARHNGEPSGTTASVQRLVVVEETLPASTMSGGSEARRVVSYVEEPTTVVREEWVLEGGRGEASHVISQSSMFQHEVLTREELTSAGTTSSPASTVDDAVRFTTHHHLERGLGAAGDVDQPSSLKASMAAAYHEQHRIDAQSASQTEAPQDTVRELQAPSTERQANGRRDGDTAAPFDIRDWGKPLGLPVPPDPSSKSSKTKKAGAAATPRDAADVVYVDLTYVPHHGDPGYCDVEFFSRVRARYYVLSGTNPSQQVLDALLEAKRGWGEPDAPVTVIPTYETDALCYWIAHNQKALEEHHIDVAPSASRCTINLQDHESSCAAYRLEF